MGARCTKSGMVHRRLLHFTLSPLSPSGTFPHGFFIFPFFPPLFLVSTAIHTFVPLSFLVPFTLSTSLPQPPTAAIHATPFSATPPPWNLFPPCSLSLRLSHQFLSLSLLSLSLFAVGVRDSGPRSSNQLPLHW